MQDCPRDGESEKCDGVGVGEGRGGGYLTVTKRILTQTQYYARLMIRKDTLRDLPCYEQPNKYSAAFTRPYLTHDGEALGSSPHNLKVLLDPHHEKWLSLQEKKKTEIHILLPSSTACSERVKHCTPRK